jgi:DNA-binding CsgD family transcriptional regulator
LASARRQSLAPNEQPKGRSDHSLLTSRELQILQLVAAGQANKELARSLFLTENTIETHLRRINAKLGTRTARRHWQRLVKVASSDSPAFASGL